jgi:hypothetical protein
VNYLLPFLYSLTRLPAPACYACAGTAGTSVLIAESRLWKTPLCPIINLKSAISNPQSPIPHPPLPPLPFVFFWIRVSKLVPARAASNPQSKILNPKFPPSWSFLRRSEERILSPKGMSSFPIKNRHSAITNGIIRSSLRFRITNSISRIPNTEYQITFSFLFIIHHSPFIIS